jgi:putative ABC transport system ATP-binding protein
MTQPSPAPASVATGPIVETATMGRRFDIGTHVVDALSDISLTIERGALVAIHGRSGSGKTTLLNLIGGLDRPTTGTVSLDGEDVTDRDERDLVEIRRHKVGFIFQAFGLIPILTAQENVEVPLRLTGTEAAARAERATELLELVGLGERTEHRPHELSGGEQQRVAIARSLANHPQLLLADEPTGQLDSGTGRMIMSLIHSVVRSEQVTAIVATHDPALIDIADRVIGLTDGRIATDTG